MWTIIILVLFVLVAVGALTVAIRMKPAKRTESTAAKDPDID